MNSESVVLQSSKIIGHNKLKEKQLHRSRESIIILEENDTSISLPLVMGNH